MRALVCESSFSNLLGGFNRMRETTAHITNSVFPFFTWKLVYFAWSHTSVRMQVQKHTHTKRTLAPHTPVPCCGVVLGSTLEIFKWRWLETGRFVFSTEHEDIFIFWLWDSRVSAQLNVIRPWYLALWAHSLHTLLHVPARRDLSPNSHSAFHTVLRRLNIDWVQKIKNGNNWG